MEEKTTALQKGVMEIEKVKKAKGEKWDERQMLSFYFDSFGFAEQLSKPQQPVLVLGVYILKHISPFKDLWCHTTNNSEPLISLDACANFLEEIEKSYCDNPCFQSFLQNCFYLKKRIQQK
ncbi:hypothetical protein RFI_05631 [Reticulomyxa filosa]|uniref:Uncharacterized protein n=1 Tax=Reticulomyxa filosa TaxID=46433 RepID=X6P022_RETFI|nr:hypothetical protein RFI_05631 [Reticulomyxa filosa]|eukprot:ETO31488.1 hypothetical protein RFI_05631 [Reticulomyxa filosa]